MSVRTLPGLRRSPGGGHDNPLLYSCLENPMDRGAWRATVHGAMGVGYNPWITTEQQHTRTHLSRTQKVGPRNLNP